MKVEAAEQSAGKVRVNVQISSEEFEEALKKGLPPFLAAMGLRISEKTDYDVALKTLADDDSDEELNRVKLDCAVSYLMPRAVEQSGFSPVCNPAIVGSERNEDGSVSFGIEIHPKPEIELSDYTPVTVTVSHPTVTEEEIDQRIDAMAALGAVTQPDIITGKPKKVPAIIDDRWVQKNVNGCNSVAQLRESLREAGMKHKQQELERLVVAKATVQFAERLTAPILDETIEAVTDNMVGELVNQLAQQGLTLQDYVVQRKITIDAMRDDARKQAVANLRQGAVLDAIVRHEGMELTDEDIEQAMGVIAPASRSRQPSPSRTTASCSPSTRPPSACAQPSGCWTTPRWNTRTNPPKRVRALPNRAVLPTEIETTRQGRRLSKLPALLFWAELPRGMAKAQLWGRFALSFCVFSVGME